MCWLSSSGRSCERYCDLSTRRLALITEIGSFSTDWCFIGWWTRSVLMGCFRTLHIIGVDWFAPSCSDAFLSARRSSSHLGAFTSSCRSFVSVADCFRSHFLFVLLLSSLLHQFLFSSICFHVFHNPHGPGPYDESWAAGRAYDTP